MAALNADCDTLPVAYATTHARHDSATCLAPGLFRGLKRYKDRKRDKLDVTYTFGANRSVRFRGPDALGADDLRVLQFLVAASGPRDRGSVIAVEPKSESGAALRAALELKGEAANCTLVEIHTSRREVLRELGLAWNFEQGRAVADSIARLAAVTLQVRSGDTEVSSGKGLLSYEIDHATDRIAVSLNFMLSAAVLGDAGQYVRIPMAEVRALKSDAARLIHQRLCAWVDPGRKGYAKVETLARYVYPEPSNDRRARSKRAAMVRRALDELSAIGWQVDAAGAGKVEIARPASTVAGRNGRQAG